jgi:hypothetical protein
VRQVVDRLERMKLCLWHRYHSTANAVCLDLIARCVERQNRLLRTPEEVG